MRWTALAWLVAAAAVALGIVTRHAARPAHVPALAQPALHGLHVSGGRLLDGQGHAIRLIGVNRSGTEYACIQGWGIFDGPRTAASVRAMASWHVNEVRVPLNEDCWLGINGVDPRFSLSRYRGAIQAYVHLLEAAGIYPELSLIWAAPGSYRATYQSGAPDADHAPALWASLARTFRGDPDVVLAPWGETIVDPSCFLHGGVCEATYGPHNRPYRTAGMQQAVSVMRAAGFTGVISIPGVNFANDLSHWLADEPKDPLHNLIAEAHVYGTNTCASRQCLQATMAPVARRVPLLLGEVGESVDGSDCGSSRIARIIGWADSHHVSYSAWTWDTWGNCSALIASYAGRPANRYGAWIKAHYAQVRPRRLTAGG